jgi:hypothetical protein
MNWTILKEDEPYITPSTGKKSRRVIAKCICGNIKSVMYTYIKTGRSKSCGCVQKNVWKTIFIKHNKYNTSEYNAWKNMKQRCNNSKRKDYVNYGGRGIKVCDRWLNSFINFYKDMGSKPGPEYSIDRYPNNDGNYEPSNCRWATSTEQNRNKR